METTVKVYVYFNDNSGNLRDFHNQIRYLIDVEVIKYDFDSSTYTVPTDFIDQFLAIAKENNCTAELDE